MSHRVLSAAAAAAFFVAGAVPVASVAATLTAPAPVAAPSSSAIGPARTDAFGVWRNPKDNVRVEIRPCGAAACGTVVWAAPRTLAKAREAGTPNLIGVQVLKNLELDERRGVWRGKVFVPEMNRNFTGIAEPVDAGRLLAKGCVLGGLLCKSQVWTKVA